MKSGALIEIFDLARTWNVREIEEREARDSLIAERLEIDHGTALLHAFFTGTPAQIRQSRIDHLLWMVENTPELEILGTPAALIGQDGEPLGDSVLRQRLTEASLKELAAFPDNFDVLDHAINFLEFADSQKALTFLINAKGWPKAASGWDTSMACAECARAYALAGEKTKALNILDALKALGEQRYVSPFDIAVVYVGLGDLTSACQCLEEAYRERVFRIIELTLPMFDSLRSDCRWQDLVGRIGLPQ